VPDLQSNPGMLEFLSNFTGRGFTSVLIFLGVGTLLTIVVQSSSATMAITLIMCAKGWLPFDLGAAMVLGENIGTTITANLAALPANVSAKRAALAHSLFNIFGVIWMMTVFYPVIHLIANIVSNVGPGDPNQLAAFTASLDKETLALISDPNATGLTDEQAMLKEQLAGYQVATSYGLSLFHTLFNLTNTLIMIWLVKLIARVVSYIIPKKETDEEFQLKFISRGLLSTSELSLLQAGKEVTVYGERTRRMFEMVHALYEEKNENEFTRIFSRIEKYESISDRMELEIADYLTKVADGRLSEDGKHQLRKMLRVISEIESVGDGCYNLAKTILRKRNDKSVYSTEMDANVQLMTGLVDRALEEMQHQLSASYVPNDNDYTRSENIENEINNFRDQLKLQNIDDVKEQNYEYQASVTYMDIIGECERIGDYIINIVQAMNDIEKED
jgi:phosphate:Na+ symporter